MLDRPRGPGAFLALFLSAASLFLPSSATAHIPRAALDSTPTSADRLEELRYAEHLELGEKSHLGVALQDAAYCLITGLCKSRSALGKIGWLGRDPHRAHFFWQGRELDPATGLMDFRNRWYSPAMGRWLTRDPLGYPDGPNQYGGFRANPGNFRDPMGTVAGLRAGVGRYDLFTTIDAQSGIPLIDCTLLNATNSVANLFLLAGNAATNILGETSDAYVSAREWTNEQLFPGHPGELERWELALTIATGARPGAVEEGIVGLRTALAQGDAFLARAVQRTRELVGPLAPVANERGSTKIFTDLPLGRAPRSPLGAGVGYADPDPAVYKNGLTPDAPVVDHKRARALRGHPTDPENLATRAWSENSRKGWHEGNYLREKESLVSRGLTPKQAEWVLEDYLRWIETDIHATPYDPSVLDKIPSP